MINDELKFFGYRRKSSEDKMRQVASIDDQNTAIMKMVNAENLNLVAEPFAEEKSAKNPGRPVFNEMLDRIEKGEANAIVCWAINRLYRNPVDEGRLRWMLQKGIIKVIKTPSREFYPDDAGLLMGVEGGQATDYVIRLSKDVKRGMNGRVAKGWRPNLAPVGYSNFGEKGDKTVIKDEKSFEIVRKVWDLLLTGTYSVSSILDIANNKWGLRTRASKRLGGRPLTLTQIYKMFKDPFYYGYFYWTNADTGEKELVKGNHPPIVTEKEYWRVQVLLGRKGKPQPKTRQFYGTGLIKCGECNGTVTAEEKHQLICTSCKYKFAYESKTECPKCHTDISEMNNPVILDYIYYHCTKRPCKTCSQGSIRLEDLEAQFNEELSKLKLDEEYLAVALDYLNSKRDNSSSEEGRIRDSLQSAFNNVQTRLSNLSREYTSSQNINREIYTSDEYIAEKKTLLKERTDIEKELNEVKVKFDQSIDATERTFNFCTFAQVHFNTTDDIQKKRDIFSTIGSNLILKDKKLSIDKLHPYLLIENEIRAQRALFAPLEPRKSPYSKRQKEAFEASIVRMRRKRDSNSRSGCPDAGFRNQCFRPLSHSSVVIFPALFPQSVLLKHLRIYCLLY